MSEQNSLPPPAAPSGTPPTPHHQSQWRQPPVIVALAAIALLGWQWIETRESLHDVQSELARRLNEGDTVAKEGRAIAKQGQESLQALQAKVGMLEGQLAEWQGQQAGLEAMYQEFSRSRDDRTLAEVDQAINGAIQQLQIAGNVQSALIALQTAESRLARANRPQWQGLRKALVADIERLKALPQIDISGTAYQLESLIARVDTLPLAFESRPGSSQPKTPAEKPGWLGSLWSDLWGEFRGLVRIERLDRPDEALLAPSSAVFLRENLKLRLMNARLSLLARDGKVFREDIRLASQWVERYFDLKSPAVIAVRKDLKPLETAPVGVDMPSLQGSLTALRMLQALPERPLEGTKAAAPAPRAAR
ncbi:MAG: hypothetical protein HGA47_07030 [Zoogloea sp.]|nr:hypothetical protein [Zoogloea sp.]